jgi:small subunit ribosomal protein S17
MAETPEENPETTADETVAAPAEDAGEPTAAAEEPAAVAEAPAGTRAERMTQRRNAKAKAKPSGPRTLEDRLEERRAHRERNARQRTAYRAKLKAKRTAVREAAPAVEEQPHHEHGPGRPKVRQGVVISDKGEKTITVRIDFARRHRRYHKILRTSTTLHVHDERNDAHAGDTVRVQECRPMSRLKRWRLLEVLERAR